jgi:hypothetical protein
MSAYLRAISPDTSSCSPTTLVVWAIWEGRECARGPWLMGQSDLPSSPMV